MFKQLFSVLFIIVVAASAVYPFLQVNKSPSKEVEHQNQSSKLAEEVVVQPIPEQLPDFSVYTDVKQKKHAFFGYLAPLVRQINIEILSQREFVLGLDSFPKDEKSQVKLEKLLKRFAIKNDQSFSQLKHQLLLRVDALPVELVLMQAANESAWGTSRFALVANNLFGQWCFKKGCGVVPSGRPDGESYEVRKFEHPIDSIRSYFNNLNTGHAYVDLRAIRLATRDKNKSLNPSELAEGLLSYSIRREDYVEEIKTMIRINSKYIPRVSE